MTTELTTPEAFTVALELAKWQRDEPMQAASIKIRVPIIWYSGESYTPPPYREFFVSDARKARKIIRRVNKVFAFRKAGVNITSGRKWEFTEEIEKQFGADGYGYISGRAKGFYITETPIPSECRCGRPMNALSNMCPDCEAKFTTDGEWEPEQDL